TSRYARRLPALRSRFFFSSRRRHTRFSRDWSSDVCSSDLRRTPSPATAPPWVPGREVRANREACRISLHASGSDLIPPARIFRQIGRASCREREEISVVAVSSGRVTRRCIEGIKREQEEAA